MNKNRKDGEVEYKEFIISYSVYGEESSYGGTAHIDVHRGHCVEVIRVVIEKPFDTLDKAESEIVKLAKLKINEITRS